jgi:putative oxidoreductase
LQRLFSTFANGWPGRGLLLQRLLTAAVLFYSAIAHLGQAIPLASTVLQMIGAGAGILLLVGLWTPVVGTLVAVLEVWIASSVAGDLLVPVMLATLGATLAMIGPGAWSLDAWLFGRKRIETPER